jgi:DNA-binding MarR family transcriptional regulator
MSQLLDNIHRIAQIADNDLALDIETYAARLAGTSQRQIAVLRAVDEFGRAPSQTDIVERTGIDRSTLADIVRRLLKKDLLQRRRTKEDARAYAVTLTADGKRALADARLCEARVERELIEAMPVMAKLRDMRIPTVNRTQKAKPAPGKRQTYQEPARAVR